MAHSMFYNARAADRAIMNAQYKLRNYFLEALLTTIYMRGHDLVLYTGEIVKVESSQPNIL